MKKILICLLSAWLLLTSATVGVTAEGIGDAIDGAAGSVTDGDAEVSTPVSEDSLKAISVNGRYYKFFSTLMTWNEAEEVCRSLGGHLVTISDAAENELVRRLFVDRADYAESGTVWLGNSNSSAGGDLEWVTGEPYTYTNWKHDAQNGWYSTLNRGYMDSNGQWGGIENVTIEQEPVLGFVCEWEPDTFAIKADVNGTTSFQGHQYQFIEHSCYWEVAVVACQRMGGHPVTIGSLAEHKFVRELSLSRAIWLGGSDILHEGSFTWITGEPLNYTPWNFGEPNNYQGDQDAMYMYANGTWDDTSTRTQADYVCEWDGICLTEDGFHTTHEFGEWTDTIPATCEAGGVRARSCIHCHLTESYALPAQQHRYGVPEVDVAAGCSHNGHGVRRCALCDSTVEVVLPAVEHNYGEFQVISGSKIIPPIVSSRSCEICSHTETIEDWSYIWIAGLIIVGIIGALIGVINYAKAFRK